MVKQHIKIQIENLGHNNPPVKIVSIDFVNLKIYNI